MPNSCQVHAALWSPILPDSELPNLPSDSALIYVSCPFTTLVAISVPIRCDDPTLGLCLGSCAACSRAFIFDIHAGSTCSTIHDWCKTHHTLVYALCPFTTLVAISVPIRCDGPTLGLCLGSCAACSRGLIFGIQAGSTCINSHHWCMPYHGSYVVQMNDTPVFSQDTVTPPLDTLVVTTPKLAHLFLTPIVPLTLLPRFHLL
jgi:hypothetical protein